MRSWMIGFAFVLLPASLFAQTTKAPPASQKGGTQNTKPPAATSKEPMQATKGTPAKASDADMDRLLKNWESKSRGVRDVECEFRRISKDAIFKTEEVEYGKASGIKPYQGRLDLADADGNFTQIFIYTGKRLHQYDFKTKQEFVHILPEPDPAAGQSMPGPLGFVYGMSATEAKARFEMKLIKQFSKDGIDYAEVLATPRTQADQQDFKYAQILINQKTFLPKELKLVEPNGNEQRWIFDRLETNLNPPVSTKELEPFSTDKLKNWKRVVNNLADPPKSGEAPKTNPNAQGKAGTEAGRTTPTKR